MNTHRRHFLKRSLLVPLAAALPGFHSPAALAPIQRTGRPRLLPALNAYSFSDLLVAHSKDPSKGLDLFAVCDFCARQDLDAVDLTAYFFPGYPHAPEDSYLFRLKRYAHNLGLAISGTGVRNDFTSADQAVRATGVQLTRDWIKVAAKLGAPCVRVFADSQAPNKNWREAAAQAPREAVEAWVAEALRQCAEFGEKYGVIVAVQNHGDFISTGAEHVSLLERVGHEWCRALVDTGKYLSADPYADIAQVAPYAVNWQIKETTQSRVDSPRTDFKKLVGLIHNAGYRGYLPIETLSMGRKDYDPFVEVPKVLGELRSAIIALGG